MPSATQQGVRHLEASTRRVNIPGCPTLYWQPEALRLVARHRPDSVIALGSVYSLTAWCLCLYGRWKHIPVLLWGHGLLAQERGIKWWIRRMLYKLAAGHLLYGDHARQLLLAQGFSAETLHVVYNSLNYDSQMAIADQLDGSRCHEWRRRLGVQLGERVVVFTGRLEPQKRLDLLFEAMARLRKKGRHIHAVLIGEGRERQALEALAQQSGLRDRAHFLGEHYDEELLGLVLTSSDLCVIPSAAGLSVMHAFVFGTPVLLHDRHELHGPEWEAVSEGKTGFFYRYGDVDHMSAQIEQALFPAPRKMQMAADCQAVVRERYNPYRQVEWFKQAIRSTLRQQAA